MKNSVVHFEIPADEVERAKQFYVKTFGWEMKRFEMPNGDYWSVQTTDVDKDMKPTAPGINGGLMKRQNAGQRS